ncbi:MAG TPA: 2OG-Fe(II) oxygenase [Pyrinomonadaceae bacterium]|jgi:Rps23 Pro-64 3,4-dihydroxylase Tpa1-like proline 4-hydroxylase
MHEELVGLILERLEKDADAIKADFHKDKGITTRFTAIDDFLPEEIARKIYEAFPPTEKMRLLDSFREKKYTSKDFDEFDPLMKDATFAFQDERVVEKIAGLTGILDPKGDPHLYAGGLSAMTRGHFLNPHLDNSHDYEQKYYRVLNLLYYVTPGWKPENGGNLELWDTEVTKAIEIPSLFNRLVLMATNDKSYHSVNEVRGEGARCCVSNYYFSPHSPNGYETSHVTYFQARPEQTVRRLVTKVDSDIRTALRKVVKKGFAKKDLYEGEK